MSVTDAVRKIAYLVEMGLQLKKTGVELKDKMTDDYLPNILIKTDYSS
jgi:hypothetical protein